MKIPRRFDPHVALSLPAIVLVVALFVVPMVVIARVSFDHYISGGQQVSTASLENYGSALTDSLEVGAIGRTLYLGVVVTLLTILASYPIAYFLARFDSRWRAVLLTLAVAPLLTADVVRVYGWLVVLGSNGLVNSALMSTGVIQEPIRLVYNETGTIIGLVEILMPYAILTLFSSMITFDLSLEEAATSLGASRYRTFLRVTLPMSLPGVAVAALLVLVLTISSYVTPTILGGGRVFTVAVEVYRQATLVLNWPLAAALAVLLLLGFGLVLALYSRLARRLEWSIHG